MQTLSQLAKNKSKKDIKCLRKLYIVHAINEGLVNYGITYRARIMKHLGACRFNRNGISICKTTYGRSIHRNNFHYEMSWAKNFRGQLEKIA